MLKAYETSCRFDGTAALDALSHGNQEARIIVFPDLSGRAQGLIASMEKASAIERMKSFAARCIARSEMACSLMLEDFRGCSYDMFSKIEAVIIGTSAAAIALISLVVGC